jgi:hypothetical protein
MASEQNSTPITAPKLAFLGFCDRAETLTHGRSIPFWSLNLLGVSLQRAFFIFPTFLKGISMAIAIYQPRTGDTYKLKFRGSEGRTFDITLQITGASVGMQARTDSPITHSDIPVGELADPGWVFMVSVLGDDIAVNAPGLYGVFLETEGGDQCLTTVSIVQLTVPPYTPEQIVALRSDPLACKTVRVSIACKLCRDSVKAYAGLERLPALETQGYQWNLDLPDDVFVCSCGKTTINRSSIRTGLHGFLQRNVSPQASANLSAVRLYEKTVLEQYCGELLALIEADTREEDVQKFLEDHPIFFHIFLPKKIMFKPPILTDYRADFAVLNSRDELLLVEIERPKLRLLKADGDITAGLSHAFYQVRTWTQKLDDYRGAALDAMGLELEEVVRVKSVVVAGLQMRISAGYCAE